MLPSSRWNEVLLNWNHEWDSNPYLRATFLLVDIMMGRLNYSQVSESLSFLGMPPREQGVPRTSGAKTKQGEFLYFFGGEIL